MCGVSAILKFSGVVTRQDLGRMSSAIAHRGPDESGYTILERGRVGLAHVRLSIVDLRTGQQPLFNEDGSVALSFNGEIYDHAELRSDLVRRGHEFLTHSDSEVIVHLYEEYGLNFVDYLNGEFAIVLWDARRKRLVCARDRSGIKPLYYRVTQDEIILSSEAKGILCLERVPRRFSTEYITGSFFGVFPKAPSTFDGIQSIKPGHLLLVDAGGECREQRYWSHDYTPDMSMTFEDAKVGVRERFERAVERRMVADVEVGAYLSGGIDSTLICASMAQKGVRFKAFNIGFHGTAYDESSIAARIAKHYGAEFESIDCNAEKLAGAFEATLYHTEQSISDPHSIAKQLLSKFVRSRGHKVCITGEGADEVFAGYPHFKLDQLKRMLLAGKEAQARARVLWERFQQLEARTEGHLWTKGYLKRSPRAEDGVFADQAFFVRAKGLEGVVPWLLRPELIGADFRGNTLRRYSADMDLAALAKLEPLNVGRSIGLNQLYAYIIPVLGDRVEMANSVECRTPFLDRNVLEFTDRIPPKWLINIDELREKYVLREAFATTLPEFLRQTHKHPFVSPGWGALFETPRGSQLVAEHLSRRRLEQAGVFRPLSVAALRVAARRMRGAPRRTALQALGMVLCLQVLHDRFIDQGVRSDPDFDMVERQPPKGDSRSTGLRA